MRVHHFLFPRLHVLLFVFWVVLCSFRSRGQWENGSPCSWNVNRQMVNRVLSPGRFEWTMICGQTNTWLVFVYGVIDIFLWPYIEFDWMWLWVSLTLREFPYWQLDPSKNSMYEAFPSGLKSLTKSRWTVHAPSLPVGSECLTVEVWNSVPWIFSGSFHNRLLLFNILWKFTCVRFAKRIQFIYNQ